MALGKSQRVGRPLCAAWLELLTERDLRGAQSFFAVNGRPTRCGVAAAQKLLINAFMTGSAVTCGQVGTDYKAVVIDFLLVRARLVAIQAIHALLRMSRHLVFVDDRVLKPCVALRAFTGCAHEIGCRLLCFNLRARPIDEEGRENERKGNDNGNEHRTK